MKINLISANNGVGLTQDVALLKAIFETNGWNTQFVPHNHNPRTAPTADLNIFLEILNGALIPIAKKSILIPNPEWFMGVWQGYLSQVSIFCKSESARKTFGRQFKNTINVGFTSRDLYDPKIQKQPAFFHLAGSSTAKQTNMVLDLWRSNPGLPMLTVLHGQHKVYNQSAPNIHKISRRVTDSHLKTLMNSHKFHVCPSEVEGYGHYINEGAGCGAVVITTDAPPMNEIMGPDRGIMLKTSGQSVLRKGLKFKMQPDELLRGINQALSMTPEQCGIMGMKARSWFLDNDKRFRREICDRVLGIYRGVRA